MAARLTALVTGGASGLGRATALNLAARGMGVVVADITNETDFEDSNIRYAQTDVSSLSAFPSIQRVRHSILKLYACVLEYVLVGCAV